MYDTIVTRLPSTPSDDDGDKLQEESGYTRPTGKRVPASRKRRRKALEQWRAIYMGCEE